jgi:hypothetical protein
MRELSLSGVIVICVLCAGCDASAPSPTVASEQSAPSSPQPALDFTPKWDVTSNVDRMSNAQQWFATSPDVGAMDPMSAPYTGTRAWMAVACDNTKSTWAYVGFSQSPNLTDTELHDGYSTIHTMMKWDSNAESVDLDQKWGAKFLGFDSGDEAIKLITHHKSAMLELSWYGSGSVYFQFPMDGADKAVQVIMSKCGIGVAPASKPRKHAHSHQ